MQSGVGTLQETSLHASLKQWYFRPGDLLETGVDGSIVDLVRGSLCIEIQTQHFGALRKKVSSLLKNHAVRVVYPVPAERHIVRIDINTDQALSRRKSPKRGTYLDLFTELVHITQIVKQNNFSLEVLLIREDLVIVDDGKGSWKRKGWSISDRRLVDVLSSKLFTKPGDYRELIPAGLTTPFTVRDLASSIRYPRYLASKMAYTLREIGVIETVGKKGRSFLYCVRDS